MSTLSPALRRPVLVEFVPGARVRDVTAVVVVALLTAAAAQVVVPLPFSPVPISGQTFAVLLGAAALGPWRGAAAQALYWVLGLALPFYSGGESGWQVATGATGGYLVGFVLASVVVGFLARRGADRRVWSTVLAFVVGSAVIYALGATWLALRVDATPVEALQLGVVPFLAGDLVKALLAGALLPTAWRRVRR